MTLVQPPRRPFDEILAGLTELAPTDAELQALPPGERMALLAASVSGLGAVGEDEDNQQLLYLRVVCPERDLLIKQRIYVNVMDWERMASCGLTARSHLRRFGVRSKLIGLDAGDRLVPYTSGEAIDDVIQTCKAAGAWRTSGLPTLGALVVIGQGLQTHVLTITKRIADDLLSTSVDGGQVVGTTMVAGKPAALYGILTRVRQLHWSGSQLVFGDRAMQGWADPERLAESAVPSTFELI